MVKVCYSDGEEVCYATHNTGEDYTIRKGCLFIIDDEGIAFAAYTSFIWVEIVKEG